jgi:ribosome-binding factor A
MSLVSVIVLYFSRSFRFTITVQISGLPRVPVCDIHIDAIDAIPMSAVEKMIGKRRWVLIARFVQLGLIASAVGESMALSLPLPSQSGNQASRTSSMPMSRVGLALSGRGERPTTGTISLARIMVRDSSTVESASALKMAKSSPGRSRPNALQYRMNGSKMEKSKRQERIGQLVRSELATIIHRGLLKGDCEFLESDLRQRISVVNIDVSPDLRQARVSVSVRVHPRASTNARDMQREQEPTLTIPTMNNAAVDKRRAYGWLVRNTKPIRHALAQRISHLKICPNLTFVQVDVAAAVDVMFLIEQITAKNSAKRQSIDLFESAESDIAIADDHHDDDGHNNEMEENDDDAWIKVNDDEGFY